MNKAVMLSIKPEWCCMIFVGAKNVELRKSRPKTDLPLKCFIYETQAASENPWVDEDGHFIFKGRGAVIGEFVCDRIEHLDLDSTGLGFWENEDFQYLYELHDWKTALTRQEIINYCNGMRPYGWHISSLVGYDTPRPLSDFGLTRPPQSWCYVQEAET